MSQAPMNNIHDRSTREHHTALYVSQSRLRDGGNGIFTQKKIKQGDTICEYFGRYITRRDYLSGRENKHYCVGNKEETYIISALNEQGEIVCAGGYINDILDDILTNCAFKWIGDRCFIVASQDIDIGEELYISYGWEFWMSPEWNVDILRMARDCYNRPQTNPIQLWNELIASVEDDEDEDDDSVTLGSDTTDDNVTTLDEVTVTVRDEDDVTVRDDFRDDAVVIDLTGEEDEVEEDDDDDGSFDYRDYEQDDDDDDSDYIDEGNVEDDTVYDEDHMVIEDDHIEIIDLTNDDDDMVIDLTNDDETVISFLTVVF